MKEDILEQLIDGYFFKTTINIYEAQRKISTCSIHFKKEDKISIVFTLA